MGFIGDAFEAVGDFVGDVVDGVVDVINDIPVIGDFADDVLGLDPNGGGIVPIVKGVATGVVLSPIGGFAGGFINSGLGLGLGAAGQAALGGATIGAATGGVKGAVTGAAGGYIGSVVSQSLSNGQITTVFDDGSQLVTDSAGNVLSGVDLDGDAFSVTNGVGHYADGSTLGGVPETSFDNPGNYVDGSGNFHDVLGEYGNAGDVYDPNGVNLTAEAAAPGSGFTGPTQTSGNFTDASGVFHDVEGIYGQAGAQYGTLADGTYGRVDIPMSTDYTPTMTPPAGANYETNGIFHDVEGLYGPAGAQYGTLPDGSYGRVDIPTTSPVVPETPTTGTDWSNVPNIDIAGSQTPGTNVQVFDDGSILVTDQSGQVIGNVDSTGIVTGPIDVTRFDDGSIMVTNTNTGASLGGVDNQGGTFGTVETTPGNYQGVYTDGTTTAGTPTTNFGGSLANPTDVQNLLDTNAGLPPVVDASRPYDESTLGPLNDGGIINIGGTNIPDVATIVAGGLVIPPIIDALTPPTPPTSPYDGQTFTPTPPGERWSRNLVTPNMLPSYVGRAASVPYYDTTSPVQSQYYWGVHPYVPLGGDLAQYNNIPEAPAQPWGLQRGWFEQPQQPVAPVVYGPGMTPIIPGQANG